MNALSHPFFLHAVLAGGAIAVAAGLTGYFLVLRAQVFTGEKLPSATTYLSAVKTPRSVVICETCPPATSIDLIVVP